MSHNPIPEHTLELGALRADVDTLKQGQARMMKLIEKQDERIDKTNETLEKVGGILSLLKPIVLSILTFSILAFIVAGFTYIYKLILPS